MIASQEVQTELDARDAHEARSFDTFTIFNRKRNAHACIMSIVFIVLYPLGAISLHLPIEHIPYLRESYLRNKVMAIHVPIQAIAFVMMVGGMALGIRLGHDLGYLAHPVQAHVVIGLLTVSTIIIFQPIMGILQHMYFRKTGRKSVFAYIHRWTGRGAVALGMINSGLGFKLAKANVVIPKRSYVRSYALLAVLVSIWISFVIFDEFRIHRKRTIPDGGEKGAVDETKPASIKSTSNNQEVLPAS
jgi:hypothetical protein